MFRLMTSQHVPASHATAATTVQGVSVCQRERLISSVSAVDIFAPGNELARMNQVEGLIKLEASRRDDNHVCRHIEAKRIPKATRTKVPSSRTKIEFGVGAVISLS